MLRNIIGVISVYDLIKSAVDSKWSMKLHLVVKTHDNIKEHASDYYLC